MRSSTTGSWSSVLILTAGFLVLFIGGGARFAVPLTLREMAAEFDMGREMMGLIVGLYFTITAASMFIAGRLIDRMGPRIVLALGLIVAAAGIGFVSIVSAAWQALVLFGVVFAIGNGIASITPVSVLVTRSFPNRAGIANSIVISGMSFGQLVMIAGMAAVVVSIGWRSVYVWVGLAHLALVPLMLLLPKTDNSAAAVLARSAGPAGSTGRSTLKDAAGTRQFWLLLGVYAMCGFDDFFVSTHIVAFAEDRGITKLLAGNLLGLMGLTALAGVFWAGAWSDKSGPVRPLIACFVLRLASFVLILIDQSQISVAIFSLVFGITFLMTAPLTAIFVRNAFGSKHIGSISGLIIMVHHMCGGVGAWLGGAVFDHRGNYDFAFWVMLVSTLIATALSLAMRSDKVHN